MAVQRTRRLRLVGLLAFLVSLIVIGSITVPPLLLRDAPAPARIAPFVDDARTRLLDEIDHVVPIHLRLVAARCRADGGALLVFEHWEPPYLVVRHSYAMSGTWPPSGWGGGIGMEDLAGDPEIAAFLMSGEVPCE